MDSSGDEVASSFDDGQQKEAVVAGRIPTMDDSPQPKSRCVKIDPGTEGGPIAIATRPFSITRCCICGDNLRQLETLRAHLAQTHFAPVLHNLVECAQRDGSALVCPICKGFSGEEDSLFKHINIEHGWDTRFICM